MVNNDNNKIKILKKESGLSQDIWIGPVSDRPTPRSYWRIYNQDFTTKISFSENNLKVWGESYGLDLSELQKWVKINYKILVKIFAQKNCVTLKNELKKFLVCITSF